LRKLANAMQKITLIRVCFRIEKEKVEFEKLYKSSKYIRQVMKNDHGFMKQIQRAMPETYHYLDQLLKEQEDQEFDFIIQQEEILYEQQQKKL
jgi:hypothetical protein